MIPLPRRLPALLIPAALSGCAPAPTPLPPPPPLPPVHVEIPSTAPPAAQGSAAPASASATPPPEPPAGPPAAAATPPSLPECGPGLEMWEGAEGTLVVSDGDDRTGLRFYDLDGNALDTGVTEGPGQRKGELSFSAHLRGDPGDPDTVLAYELRRVGADLQGARTTLVERRPRATEMVSLARTCPPPSGRGGASSHGGARRRKKKR